MTQTQVTLISALGVLIGSIAALATAYNALKSRQGNAQTVLVQTYAALVESLQTEVTRLNQENEAQRKEIDALSRRLVALEKRGR